MDVGESFGNPAGRAAFTDFYRAVVKRYGLGPKACLLAQSRGGLMLYNWAAEHADCVQCIGGIYTVCDQSSWPGLAKSCPAYGMTEAELAKHLAEHNPIDRLAPLARAKIPILHLHGDADTLVPLDRNSGELARRYRALGGASGIGRRQGQRTRGLSGVLREPAAGGLSPVTGETSGCSAKRRRRSRKCSHRQIGRQVLPRLDHPSRLGRRARQGEQAGKPHRRGPVAAKDLVAGDLGADFRDLCQGVARILAAGS